MNHRVYCLWAGAFVLAALTTGCATMAPVDQTALPEGIPPEASTASADQSTGVYVVELRPDRGEHERVEIPFQDVPYVQTALEQSGALAKFRRMKVDVVRNHGGNRQKMRSSYDHIRKQVPIEWDYALYPGDKIIVTEDASSMFDDMVESAFGPMAILNR